MPCRNQRLGPIYSPVRGWDDRRVQVASAQARDSLSPEYIGFQQLKTFDMPAAAATENGILISLASPFPTISIDQVISANPWCSAGELLPEPLTIG
jgi:hypothetical protein